MSLTYQAKNTEQVVCRLRALFANDQADYEVTVRDAATNMQGYVVLWNIPQHHDANALVCAKGGTRITETLTLEEVRRLAKTMALKNATANLPIGGAKSGICAGPDSQNFESCYRSFVRKLKPLLSEHGGPFGGFGFDIGAKPEHALWACDELNSTRSFTGKPRAMGGTDYDKEGIAGLGVAVAAREACQHFGESIEHIQFAVQGIGAMGAGVIRYFSQFGAKLAVISDPRIGGSFILRQPPSQELLEAIIALDISEARRMLSLCADGPFALDDALRADVDVLFPCAVQDVLREDNIASVRARYVVEGANNPSSDAAKNLFTNAGGILLPDILANPGGIIAAFVEMQAGAGILPPSGMSLVEHAKAEVKRRIAENCREALLLAATLNISIPQSVELLSLSRLYPNNEASNWVREVMEHVNSVSSQTLEKEVLPSRKKRAQTGSLQTSDRVSISTSPSYGS